MSAFQVFNLPPQQPLSSSGRILPGCKIGFYLTNTSTPADVYTTSDLDTAHTQPLEADAGGRFDTVYLDPSVTYKCTVTDANDVLLYTVDPVNDQVLSQDGIAELLYPQTAVELSAGVTPVNYLYPQGHIRRYGTNSIPGTTDMTSAIANLTKVINTAGRGEMIFEAEEYLVWSGIVSDLISLSNTTGVCIRGNGATIVTDQVDYSGGVYLIVLSGCRDTVIENLSLQGGNTSLATTGEVFLNLRSGTARTLVQNCASYDASTFITCGVGTDPGSSRIRGITILNCYAEVTYYGIQCSGDGDDLFARGFVARGCGRSYFPWNVKNHDVQLDSEHGGPFSDCLLKVYVDTSWTYDELRNIKLNYQTTQRYAGGVNQNANEALIAVDAQQKGATNQGAAIFDNIEITFDVSADNSPTNRRLFIMRRYDENGAADTASRGHQFVNWKFSGIARNAQNFVEDVFTAFYSSLGTWSSDTACNFLLQNVAIFGSNTQNGIVINGAPINSTNGSLMLHNVMTDTDISISGMGGTAQMSFENVKADNFRIFNSTTFDAGNLVDGAGTTTTVTVTGAALGDMAFASFGVDLQGITCTAWVSAADTVSVRLQNESGGAIDLANATVRAWVKKKAG